METEQASYARPRSEMMSTNSLKRKPETKIWIPAITSALILTVLILGCYQKISDSGNPNFVNQTDQRMTLSEKDLNNFGSSMKVIDGQAESHYKMALYFQRRKKHKFAIEELKIAIRLNPLFTNAYNAMGVSYDNLGHYSQAIGCYRSALKLDPALDYVHNNLGYSYLLKNNLDAAIAAFQKAIELNENNKRYRSNLGLAYVMKDQYDKAYAQFRIIEGDTGAKEKMAKLLDKLGKEKPDHYLAKYSDSEHNREKSESQSPVVIRRKIHDEETKSLIKADHSVQKSEDQEIKDEQIPLSDKEALLKPDKDVSRIDETGISKSHSRDASAKNPEIIDLKKVKSLESTDKRAHRELQIVSKHYNQTAYSEFIEEDNAENKIAATDVDPIQIIAAEDQKPPTINEKARPETKTDIQKAKDSSVSSDRVYSISAVELVSDPVSEKKSSAESVKSETSRNEDANRIQNTVEPKVIEVDESYYQDAKETVIVTPAKSKDTKSDLTGTNHTILKKKQPSVYAQAAPTITSTDRKTDDEIVQSGPYQWNGQSNLAAKETDLTENSKSEDITVEIEIIVANGNGVNGAAGRFRAYLKSKGYKVAKVTNANSFDHASTKIFYCNGGKKDVYKLLQQIPFVLDQRSIIELKNLKNRFKIIIGKDQIKHDKIISRSIHRKPKS
ncbi:MAG: tetratricopeptide repeat protein [Desulfobacterales bacterium]|nr:tetratricopeptide repeat protein [Desulfobacterales bacterium]